MKKWVEGSAICVHVSSSAVSFSFQHTYDNPMHFTKMPLYHLLLLSLNRMKSPREASFGLSGSNVDMDENERYVRFVCHGNGKRPLDPIATTTAFDGSTGQKNGNRFASHRERRCRYTVSTPAPKRPITGKSDHISSPWHTVASVERRATARTQLIGIASIPYDGIDPPALDPDVYRGFEWFVTRQI